MRHMISLWITITMLFYLTPSGVHAKIVYNRKNNTIIITGTHTFSDIAHMDTKNGWGVFHKQGNNQFETDAKIKPSVELVSKIADALDVTVDYLLDRELNEMEEEQEDLVFFRGYKDLNEDSKELIRQQLKILKKHQAKKNK